MRPLLSLLPKGDGHPVLVLPGFMASDSSTSPLRKLLADLGYATFGWGLGRNVRIDQRRLREMEQLLLQIYQETGRKVSLVGWSLGGVFARELAKLQPDAVRQVISLGSPIHRDHERRLGHEQAGEAAPPSQVEVHLVLRFASAMSFANWSSSSRLTSRVVSRWLTASARLPSKSRSTRCRPTLRFTSSAATKAR